MNETPDDVHYERPALQRQPRGWLTPQVLYLTRSEHEQLKADNSKLLKREGVTVIEIPEDEATNEGGDIEMPLEKEVEYFETRDKDWDDERTALPVEIPFEEEVERISPNGMIAMQTTLHDKSLGISLLGKSRRGRPKKSPEPNPATVVTTAIRRLWKILRACHEEKWRRQRESSCYAAIAAIPLESLGRSTIELLRQGKSLPEAANIAVTQIECDAYRRLWVSRGGTHGEGISWFLYDQNQHEQHSKALAKMPKGKWQRDMSFEEGLEVLFPLESRQRPGRTDYRGARRRKVQRERFKDLLIDFVLGEHPKVLAAEEERKRPETERWAHPMNLIKMGAPVQEIDKIEPLSHNERLALLSKEEQKEIMTAVGKRLKKMERTGIPKELFRTAKLWVTTRAKGGAH